MKSSAAGIALIALLASGCGAAQEDAAAEEWSQEAVWAIEAVNSDVGDTWRAATDYLRPGGAANLQSSVDQIVMAEAGMDATIDDFYDLPVPDVQSDVRTDITQAFQSAQQYVEDVKFCFDTLGPVCHDVFQFPDDLMNDLEAVRVQFLNEENLDA